MRRAMLFVYLLVSGAIAAMAGGFLAAVLFVLVTGGPMALVPAGLVLGVLGAAIGLKLAIPPAIVIGGLLWCTNVRNKWVWAGIGALAGLGLYAFVRTFPGTIDSMAASVLTDPEGLVIAVAIVLAAAFAALLFRVLMVAFTAFDDALSVD